MRYPCLIPKSYCKTEVELFLEHEGVSEYGEPLPEYHFSGKGNYQDKARTIYTAEKKIVEITGVLLIPGDMCPAIPVISSGRAVVFGETRKIQEGRKARNPDGTVNYTEVYLK